jgi:hypothetical protein
MFDLEMPPALQPLSYLAGQAWPAHPASEKRMSWHKDDLWATADGLEALIPQLAWVAAATQSVLVGEMAAAAGRHFDLLFGGPYAVDKLVEALRALGGLADNLSELIRYMKLQIISTLGIAAAQISWAVANAAETLSASLAVIPAAEEAAILTINKLVAEVAGRIVEALASTLTKTMVSRLALEGLVSAGIGGVQEAGVQALRDVLDGRPVDVDWGQVFASAWSMGVAGVTGGLAGHVVGEVLGPAKDLATQIGKGALTGGISATTAFAAGTVAGGNQLTWMTVWGGLIGLGHGVAPGGGHATAGREPTEAGAVAGGRLAPVRVEGLAGAGRDGAVNSGEVGSAAHGATAPVGGALADPVVDDREVNGSSLGSSAAGTSVDERTVTGVQVGDKGAGSPPEAPAAVDTGHSQVSGVPTDPGTAKGTPDSAMSVPRAPLDEAGVGGAGLGGRDPAEAASVTPEPGAVRGAASDHDPNSGAPNQDGAAHAAAADKSGAEPAGAAVAHTAETPAGVDPKRAGVERVAGGLVDPAGGAGTDRAEAGHQGAPARGEDARPVTAGGTDHPPGRTDSAGPDSSGRDRARHSGRGGWGRSGVGADPRSRSGSVASHRDGVGGPRHGGPDPSARSRGGAHHPRDAWGRVAHRGDGVAAAKAIGRAAGLRHDHSTGPRGQPGMVRRSRVARDVPEDLQPAAARAADPLAAAEEIGVIGARHDDGSASDHPGRLGRVVCRVGHLAREDGDTPERSPGAAGGGAGHYGGGGDGHRGGAGGGGADSGDRSGGRGEFDDEAHAARFEKPDVGHEVEEPGEGLEAPKHGWASSLDPHAVDHEGRPVTLREYSLDEYIRMVEEKENRTLSPVRRETLRLGCIGVVWDRLGYTGDMPPISIHRIAFSDVQSHGEIANLDTVLAPIEAANQDVLYWQQRLSDAEDLIRQFGTLWSLPDGRTGIRRSAPEELEWCQGQLEEARKLAADTISRLSREHNVEDMMNARNDAKIEGNKRIFAKVASYANELNKIFATRPADAEEVVHLVQAHPGLRPLHDIGPSLPRGGNPENWEAVIIYRELWSGQLETPAGDDWVGAATPDPARFAPNPETGRVDMSNDLHQGRPGGGNYSYAWRDPKTNNWWGADHHDYISQYPMRVKQMTDEGLFVAHYDSDTSVFSIEIVNRSP